MLQTDEQIRFLARSIASMLADRAKADREAERWTEVSGWGEKEPRTADLAREICHELLESAQADGCGGCLLCQG